MVATMYNLRLVNATNIEIVDNKDGTKKLSCSVPVVDDYGNVSSAVFNIPRIDIDENRLNVLANDVGIIYTLEIQDDKYV